MNEFFVFSDDETEGTSLPIINIWCSFENTKGDRCTERATEHSATCDRHRCTFILENGSRCAKVNDCNYDGYCERHGSLCRCVHSNDIGERCKGTVYFNYHKNRYIFCDKHNCASFGCRNHVDDNTKHLCESHYNLLPICLHKNVDGHRCDEMIDDPYSELSKEEIVTSDDRSKDNVLRHDQHNYCVRHHCAIDGCYKHITSDKSYWCSEHSTRCEHVDCDNKRCTNYIRVGCKRNDVTKSIERECKTYESYCKLMNSIMENCGKKLNLCDEHRCHWTGDMSDRMQRCVREIVIDEDCSLYCKKHYEIYKFRKYEYISIM